MVTNSHCGPSQYTVLGNFYDRLSALGTKSVLIDRDYTYQVPIKANIDISICFYGRYDSTRTTLPIEFTDMELQAIIHKKCSWIRSVEDRTSDDVTAAERSRWPYTTKGLFNYADLNRIETNTIYVKEYMKNKLIIQVEPQMTHKTDWTANEVVDSVNTARIIENVRKLMELSNPVIQNDLLPLSVSNAMTYRIANAIEYNLDIMHTQPELIAPTYTVRLNGGIIEETGTNEGEFEANRAIHITATQDAFTGIDKYVMAFNYWSGDSNDLQYIGDINEWQTVFFCPHHDTELTANFKNKKIVKVVVNNGWIYGETPCSLGSCQYIDWSERRRSQHKWWKFQCTYWRCFDN